MPLSPRHFRFTPPAIAGAIVALCLAGAAFGALASSASAGSPFKEASQMNLVFTKASVDVVGSEALVPVRCEGPRSGTCNGTAVLMVQGRKHTVPFAVTGGTRSSLAVTVGSADALHGKRAVAVARTAQQSGGYLSAREVLRLK